MTAMKRNRGTQVCTREVWVMGGGSQPGPLGTTTNRPDIDPGTLNSHATPTPGPIGFNAPPAGNVRVPPAPTKYVPGVSHGHKPSGKWDEVSSRSDDGYWVCRHESYKHVAQAAINNKLVQHPIAFAHVQHYLDGSGADFNENSNIEQWLQNDQGIRWALNQAIPWSQSSKPFSSHFEFLQNQFDEEEFQFSFGSIDRVDFEVNFDRATIHVWFQDYYEWHPYYPGIYDVQDGDAPRDTNCVHAAFVEMKLNGAKDYWMKGEATVPLQLIRSADQAVHKDDKPGEGGLWGY